MTKRYPMAHKIVVAQAYRPSFDTDIRKTIKAERKRLAEAEVCKVIRVAPLVVDVVQVAPGGSAGVVDLIRRRQFVRGQP